MAAPTRVVLALDFGTTFTGVAFTTTTNFTEQSWRSQIVVIREWHTKIADKVPSSISYSPRTRGEQQYGFDIAAGSTVIVHTKLEFKRRTREREMSFLACTLENLTQAGGGPRNGVGVSVDRSYARSAHEICKDYLDNIADLVLDKLRIRFNNFVAGAIPIDLVLTHPAIWNDVEKKQTFRAALAAFNRHKFPTLRKTYFVSEPEACAVYTLKHARSLDQDRLRVDDVFVVCDAGGGTVDVVSFRVTETNPSFQMERVGNIIGDECGAIFIDNSLMFDWLRRKLTAEEYNGIFGDGSHERCRTPSSPLGIRATYTNKIVQLLSAWEGIKFNFGSEDNVVEYALALPIQIPDNEERGIRNSTIMISWDDVFQMFSPSIFGTLDLIDAQVRALVDTMNFQVKAIFLSGGFGNSPLLLKYVTDYGNEKGIPVIRGDRPQSAVVQGAVLKCMGLGVSQPAPTHRSPCHVGVVVSEPFLDHRHLHEHGQKGDDATYVDGLDHKRKAGQRVRWLVSRDDPISIPPHLHAQAQAHELRPTAVLKMTRKFDRNGQTQFRCKVVMVKGRADHRPPPTEFAGLPPLGVEGTRVIDIPYNMGDVAAQHVEAVRVDNGMFSKAVVELQVWIEVQDEHAGILAAEFRLLCAGQQLATERIIL